MGAKAMSCVLESIDRIREILKQIPRTKAEPEEKDADVINKIKALLGSREGSGQNAGYKALAPLGDAVCNTEGAMDRKTLDQKLVKG